MKSTVIRAKTIALGLLTGIYAVEAYPYEFVEIVLSAIGILFTLYFHSKDMEVQRA